MSGQHINDEDYKKLRDDPFFAQQIFSKVLGPPKSNTLSSSGFLQYRCPVTGCDQEDFKFGVNYLPGAGGGWHCFRCGVKGASFIALCKELGLEANSYFDQSYVPPPKRVQEAFQQQIRTTGETPLSIQQFATFWRWVASRSRSLDNYGEQYGGLMPEHVEILKRRGLDPNALTYWFSTPSEITLQKALQKWGEILCERAGIYNREKRARRLAFDPGRIIIGYPPSDIGQHSIPFGYIRSYNPMCKTEREREFKMLSVAGYGSGRQIYIRATPNSRPNPWVVTEAELKAECSYQARVPTLGTPGMGIGHREIAAIVIRSLIASNFQNPTGLVIAFDTEADPEHQKLHLEPAVRRLIQTITYELNKECPNFYLPIYRLNIPSTPGNKADIDSWIGNAASQTTIQEARAGWRNLVRDAIKRGPVTAEDSGRTT